MRISDWSSDVCSSDLFAKWRWPSHCARNSGGATDRRRISGLSIFTQGATIHFPAFSQYRQRLRVLEHSALRSEEHTSELQSLMRNSYAVFCLKKKKTKTEKT